MRRFLTLVESGALVVVALLLGAWSLTSLIGRDDSTESADNESPVVATVVDRDFGRDARIEVVFDRRVESLVFQLMAGVVTSVDLDGFAQPSQGMAVLSVDSVSILIAEGDLPAYRSLGQRDEGPDVVQLQQLLVDTGYLSEAAVDGVFGRRTATAVEGFNSDRGLSDFREVPLGSVIFVPDLDRPVALPTDVKAGMISPAEGVLWVALDPPLEASAALPALLQVAVGARVISSDGASIFVQSIIDGSEGRRAILAGDLAAFCGDGCQQLDDATGELGAPVDPTELQAPAVPASLELIPEQSGPALPVTALQADDDGRPFVLRADGIIVTIEVIAVQDGWALVDGDIAVGDRVRADPNP